MSISKVIRGEKLEKLVLNYTPKIFPVEVSQETSDFISQQEKQKQSDFQMSEVLSEQVGITALKRQKLESKLEDEILENLKGIEEDAYKEAYELGLVEGEKKAFEEKIVEIKEKLDHFSELLDNSQNLYRKLFEKNEALLVKMVFQIASKVAMKEISQQTDEITEVVKKTMNYIQGEVKAKVYISQQDKDFLEAIRKNISKDFDHLEKVEIETSDQLSKGDCVVETNYGVIDASVKERVNMVWQSLDEKLPTDDGDTFTNE